MIYSKATLAGIFLTAALTSACQTPQSPHRLSDLDYGLPTTANVFFSVKGDVAILQGRVELQGDKIRLGEAAARLDGIEEVQNFLSVNR